jgi:hypothetical protein
MGGDAGPPARSTIGILDIDARAVLAMDLIGVLHRGFAVGGHTGIIVTCGGAKPCES